MPFDSPINAIMGAGAHYEGDLSFEGRVRIDGHFTGRIYTEDVLEVGESGHIEGHVDAAHARISGRLQGDIHIRNTLIIESTGCIEGKLDAGRVVLREGGQIYAQVRITGAAQP